MTVKLGGSWLGDKTRFGAQYLRRVAIGGCGRACLAFDSRSCAVFAVPPERVMDSR